MDTGSVSGRTGKGIGSLEGVPRTPPASYGPYGPKEGTDQPTRGLVRPLPCLAIPREGKGGGLAPPAFPSHGRKERGGAPPSPAFPLHLYKAGGAAWEGLQVGFLLLGRLLWLLLPPSHLYICGRGCLAHNRQLPSRMWRPLHCLHPRSYFHSAYTTKKIHFRDDTCLSQ